MRQSQRCSVCRRTGLLVETLVYVTAGSEGMTMIGRCPLCLRYLCTHHVEPAGPHHDLPSGVAWRRGEAVLALCPFDIGVPLGSARSQG